jgi:hypothetical protein
MPKAATPFVEKRCVDKTIINIIYILRYYATSWKVTDLRPMR